MARVPTTLDLAVTVSMPVDSAQTLSVLRLSFETRQLAEIRTLLASQAPGSGLGVRAGPAARLRAVYLDTDDQRFRRAGYSLAIRDDGKRTEVVLDALGVPGERPVLRARAPLSHARPEDLPESCPDPVREPVRAVTGQCRLREVLRLLERRESWHIVQDDHLSGTLTLVETLTPDRGDGVPVRLSRLELEIPEDDGAGSLRLLAFLRSRFDLTEGAPTTLLATLEKLGNPLPSPPDLGETAFDRRSTAGEVAFAALRTHFARWLKHEPGTRLGADPEDLHDMRVSVRRMRAALRVFASCLPRRLRKISPELRWLGRALGGVRDLDVQLKWLREQRGLLPVGLRENATEVETAVRNARRTARREMLEALDSARYEALVARLRKWLRRGPRLKPKRAHRRAVRVAPGLIREPLREVLRAGRDLGPSSPSAEYHQLRILAKRARYALEFHEPIYGKPAARMIQRLTALQDLLGELQDSAVFLDRLSFVLEHDAKGPSEAALRVLERLRAEQRGRQKELRQEFPETFARVRGKARRKLKRALRNGRN